MKDVRGVRLYFNRGEHLSAALQNVVNQVLLDRWRWDASIAGRVCGVHNSRHWTLPYLPQSLLVPAVIY